MGVFLKTEILPECHLGVWEIAEDFDTLNSMVNLAAVEKTKLNSFKNISRKVEWLSVRTLVKTMLGKDTRILYNSENKPFVRGNTHSISITHSNNLTAVIISKDKRVGIDLEFMSGKISKVADKFMNEKENVTSDPELKKYSHLAGNYGGAWQDQQNQQPQQSCNRFQAESFVDPTVVSAAQLFSLWQSLQDLLLNRAKAYPSKLPSPCYD